MIKLFYKIVLLCIAFIVCDYLVGLGLDRVRKVTVDGLYSKNQYSIETTKAEIIVFGSSTGQNNIASYIIEDSLKMTCWNSARQGQGFPFWLSVEKAILNRYTPKIAIIEIAADYLSNNELKDFYERAGVLRPFYSSHKEIQPVIENISFYEKYFIHSRLYAYNSCYYYLVGPYFLKDYERVNKGWLPLIDHTTLKPKHFTVNSKKELNSENVILLNDLVSDLTGKGSKVFIVIPPMYNDSLINTSTIEYFKSMKNATLLDYNDNNLFTGDSLLFWDPYHLSKEGAIKYTNLLVQKLKLALKN